MIWGIALSFLCFFAGVALSWLPGIIRALALGRRPGELVDWPALIRDHADSIDAVAILVVPALPLRGLFAFVALGGADTEILSVEVTDHATARWRILQLGERFGKGLKVLDAFDSQDCPEDVAIHRPGRSSRRGGRVVLVMESIRHECLDHVIIINAAHLRRMLERYARYYNEDRTHLVLDKDAPLGRAVEGEGRIVSRPVLGGLHRRYYKVPRE